MPGPLFNKVAGLRPSTLLKKKLWLSCFPVNFAKFPRTPILTERLWTASEKACLKLVSAIFFQIFIFSPNNRPSKTMKNVFYFI